MKRRRHHYRTASWLASLSGLITGLALAGQYDVPDAIANDEKVFAAQFCVPVSHLEGSRILTSAVGHYDDGETVDYLCPLTRDNLKGGIARVWVRLFNNDENTPGEQTECCLYSADPLTQHSDFACQMADHNQGKQSLEIKGVSSWDNGHYALRCTLEQGDLIFSYRSSEP